MNGSDIVTTSNATIDLAPNGTGTVVVRGNTNSGAIVFNCESNSHGQKVHCTTSQCWCYKCYVITSRC